MCISLWPGRGWGGLVKAGEGLGEDGAVWLGWGDG